MTAPTPMHAPPHATFALVAGDPRPASGRRAHAAIAAIRITGDVDTALAALDIPAIGTGDAALRDLVGIDLGLVAKPDASTVFLFPHAGAEVVARLLDACRSVGLTPVPTTTDAEHSGTRWPEAPSALHARLLDALTMAASPLAIDVLLDQPRRAAEHPGRSVTPEHAAAFARLLRPPTIAVLGPPNVGKSSLLNLLAGRSVALVADEPGVTRDHVGVTLDLAGLTVRWIDLPGLTGPDRSTDDLEHHAAIAAMAALRDADLVIRCTDPGSDAAEALALDTVLDHVFPAPAPGPRPPVLGVLLRADLAPPPRSAPALAIADVHTAAPRGIPEFVTAIRDALVPPAALADPRPWRFWDLPAPARHAD